LDYYRKGTHEIPDGTGTLPGDRSDARTPRPGSTPPGTSTPKPPRTDRPSDSRPGPRPTKPGGGTGTPGTPTPSPTPTPTPTPTTPPGTPQTPTDTVHHLEHAGTAELSARAGDAFTQRISARAETDAGKAVAKVRVRFTVVGDTDTTFTGGEKVATVVTDRSGVAVATAPRAAV